MRWQWCGTLCFGVVAGVALVSSAKAGPSRDPSALSIHVWKSRHVMALREGDETIRQFDVALGKDSRASKLQRGDGRTPVGSYYVCEKRPSSRFRRFIGISYPNIQDAEKAFAERLINDDEWADIFFANLRQTTPPWRTALGGEVGIHGLGGREFIPVDWTEGCIAVRDADIEYLYDHVSVGTPVIIDD